VKPAAETDHRKDPRRSGQRSLGAAEGVLVALRHYSLDEAFIDIVQTAKQHNVAPIGLADALVAVAANDATRDFDIAVVAAVGQAWGALLGQPSNDADRQCAPTAAADDDGARIQRGAQTHWTPKVIEPIPDADEADIAGQALPIDDGIEEGDALPDALDDNPDADATDLFDQKLSAPGQDDDHPSAADRAVVALVTGRVVWPALESDSLTTQRSFVDDMASLNEPYRPAW
jgi:hypothetical protein